MNGGEGNGQEFFHAGIIIRIGNDGYIVRDALLQFVQNVQSFIAQVGIKDNDGGQRAIFAEEGTDF